MCIRDRYSTTNSTKWQSQSNAKGRHARHANPGNNREDSENDDTKTDPAKPKWKPIVSAMQPCMDTSPVKLLQAIDRSRPPLDHHWHVRWKYQEVLQSTDRANNLQIVLTQVPRNQASDSIYMKAIRARTLESNIRIWPHPNELDRMFDEVAEYDSEEDDDPPPDWTYLHEL